MKERHMMHYLKFYIMDHNILRKSVIIKAELNSNGEFIISVLIIIFAVLFEPVKAYPGLDDRYFFSFAHV